MAGTTSSITVAICGGGACGLAIILSILERAEPASGISSIYLYEKHTPIGPGLAYSANCGAAVLNMRVDTMGIHASNPKHFRQWVALERPQWADCNYPPRYLYGEYLNSQFLSAVRRAGSMGINFQVINHEAVQVERCRDAFEIQDATGRRKSVDKVVLALGNFTARRLSRALAHKITYFPSPWPLQNLDHIPATASVCVAGSRLSGIDVALHLADKHHKGTLYLVSRGGRLPEVQSCQLPGPWQHSYALYLLARDLENLPRKVTLDELIERFRQLTNNFNVKDIPNYLHQNTPERQLYSDIVKTENVTEQWKAITNSASCLWERYWSCLIPEDQKVFMENWNSLWYTYVHAMPHPTALHLQQLLKSGQVVVSAFEEILDNGNGYTIVLPGRQVYADFLVEASGLELDTSRINSPLIESLLASGLLSTHHAGGVSVDMASLESTVANGIYAIGSLTTGVHFYTNGIDRNVNHASRIVQHLSGEPMRLPAHVAVFIPAIVDVHGFWIDFLTIAIPILLGQSVIPFIYLIGTEILTAQQSTASHLPHERMSPEAEKDISTFNARLIPIGKLCATHGIAFTSCTQSESFHRLLRQHHIDIGLLFATNGWSSIALHSEFHCHQIHTEPLLTILCTRLRENEDPNSAADQRFYADKIGQISIDILHGLREL